jgi:hypothetical protein
VGAVLTPVFQSWLSPLRGMMKLWVMKFGLEAPKRTDVEIICASRANYGFDSVPLLFDYLAENLDL